MKKVKIICFILISLVIFTDQGRADYVENFDSYIPGSNIHGQGGWSGWYGDPNAGALVSNAYSYSPENSVDIEGVSDLVHEFSGMTSGQWRLTAMQYVPSTSAGTTYFILMNKYPYSSDDSWSIQLQCNLNAGTIEDDLGGSISLPLLTNQWVQIRADVDLESNTVKVYYGGVLLSDHAWYGDAKELKVIDLYANGADSVYYDDIRIVSEMRYPDYDEIGDLDFRSDLNRDGYADFEDIADLARFWLDENCWVSYECLADIYPVCGDGMVNFQDFSRVAEQWRLCTDPTNPDCIHLPLTLKEPPNRLFSFAYPASCENRCDGGRIETVPTNPTYGVYLFSGEFHERVVDLQIPGRGFDFTWARTYRSRTCSNTRMGNGWDYSYNIKIEPCGANLIVYGGDGRRDLYISQQDGTWATEGFFRVLTQNPDLSFTLTFPDNGSWTFHPFGEPNAPGRISTITDRNGNSMGFNYDDDGLLTTIHDSLGREVTISYDIDGFIEAVTDFNGRTVSYEHYDGVEPGGTFGDLKSVTTPAVIGTPTGNDFPDGKTTVYTYSTSFADDRLNHNLLTITDPNGQTFLRNTYSADLNGPNFDRVVRQILGEPNDIIDMTYVQQVPEPNNNYTVTKTVTNDCVGNVREHFFDNRNQLVIEREYTGRADPNVPTYLNPDLNPPVGKLRPDDPNYFESRYQYTAEYLCTRIDYPNGNYTINVYEVDLDPNAPRCSRGNLREVHQFAGTLEPVSDQNEIVELFEYESGLGGCGCGGTNFVTRYVDPNGYVTLHNYDPNGNRIQTTHLTPANEPNIIEQWQYNVHGQITNYYHPTDGNNLRRDEYVYYSSGEGSQYGYLKQKILDADNLHLTLSYSYDAVGNLISQTDPNGNTTTYWVNELNQVIKETLPAPFYYETIHYYDESDNLIKIKKLFSGQYVTTDFTYDSLGRVTQVEQEIDDANSIVTQYSYDGNGNLIEEIDGNGNTTRNIYDERNLIYQITKGHGTPEASTEARNYDGNKNPTQLFNGRGYKVFDNVYDGFDRVISSTDAGSGVTSYVYDPSDNLLSETNAKGYTTTYEYDSFSRRISKTNALGRKTSYTYDSVGNKLTETDPNGNLTSYEYDLLNRLTRTIDALGRIVEYEYDSNGNCIKETSPNSCNTYYEYDSLNRLVKITNHMGFSTQYSYDEGGNIISIISPNGNLTIFEYDPLHRLITRTDPNGYETRYEYDGVGNRIRKHDELSHITQYEYDALNRLIKQIDPLGHSTSYTYDKTGNLTAETNAKGHTTSYTYDPRNQLVEKTHPLGGTTTFVYDAFGNRIQVIDPNGHSTTYTPNELNQIVAVTDARGKTIEYQYDDVGNRKSRKDKNGNLTTYSYDSINRLIRTSYPDGNGIQYEYDPAGNISRITNTAGLGEIIERTYDCLNRLTDESINYGLFTKAVHYDYDAEGNLIRLIDPDGLTIDYEYDSLNRLTKVTDRTGGETLMVYDPAGRKIKTHLPDGYWSEYTYDDVDRLTAIVTRDKTSVVVYDYSYTYDSLGNVIRAEKNGIPEAIYEYYPTNWLSDANYFTGEEYDYTYDLSGNRLIQDNKGAVTSYTYNEINRLTRQTFPSMNWIDYFYDDNGNVVQTISSWGTVTYNYDFENHLTNIIYPWPYGTIDTYYSAEGQRLARNERGTWIYYYPTLAGVAVEMDVMGNTTTQINPNISMNDFVNKRYAHWDGQDSTTHFTGSSVQASFSFDYYGGMLSSMGNIDDVDHGLYANDKKVDWDPMLGAELIGGDYAPDIDQRYGTYHFYNNIDLNYSAQRKPKRELSLADRFLRFLRYLITWESDDESDEDSGHKTVTKSKPWTPPKGKTPKTEQRDICSCLNATVTANYIKHRWYHLGGLAGYESQQVNMGWPGAAAPLSDLAGIRVVVTVKDEACCEEFKEKEDSDTPIRGVTASISCRTKWGRRKKTRSVFREYTRTAPAPPGMARWYNQGCSFINVGDRMRPGKCLIEVKAGDQVCFRFIVLILDV